MIREHEQRIIQLRDIQKLFERPDFFNDEAPEVLRATREVLGNYNHLDRTAKQSTQEDTPRPDPKTEAVRDENTDWERWGLSGENLDVSDD